MDPERLAAQEAFAQAMATNKLPDRVIPMKHMPLGPQGAHMQKHTARESIERYTRKLLQIVANNRRLDQSHNSSMMTVPKLFQVIAHHFHVPEWRRLNTSIDSIPSLSEYVRKCKTVDNTIHAIFACRDAVTLFEVEREVCALHSVKAWENLGLLHGVHENPCVVQYYGVELAKRPPRLRVCDLLAFVYGQPDEMSISEMLLSFARSFGFECEKAEDLGVWIRDLPSFVEMMDSERRRVTQAAATVGVRLEEMSKQSAAVAKWVVGLLSMPHRPEAGNPLLSVRSRSVRRVFISPQTASAQELSSVVGAVHKLLHPAIDEEWVSDSSASENEDAQKAPPKFCTCQPFIFCFFLIVLIVSRNFWLCWPAHSQAEEQRAIVEAHVKRAQELEAYANFGVATRAEVVATIARILKRVPVGVWQEDETVKLVEKAVEDAHSGTIDAVCHKVGPFPSLFAEAAVSLLAGKKGRELKTQCKAMECSDDEDDGPRSDRNPGPADETDPDAALLPLEERREQVGKVVQTACQEVCDRNGGSLVAGELLTSLASVEKETLRALSQAMADLPEYKVRTIAASAVVKRIEALPPLTEVRSALQWDDLLQPSFGSLEAFLSVKGIAFATGGRLWKRRADEVFKLPAGQDCSIDAFKAKIAVGDGVGAAGCLVAMFAQGSVALELLAAYVQTALEKLPGDHQRVQCVRSAMVALPRSTALLFAKTVFLTPLASLVHGATVAVYQGAARDEREALSALGCLLDIAAWRSSYEASFHDGIQQAPAPPTQTATQDPTATEASNPPSAPPAVTNGNKTGNEEKANDLDKQKLALSHRKELAAGDISEEGQPEAVVQNILRSEFGVGADMTDEGKLLHDTSSRRLGRAIERLASDLYSSDVHFVLELIQNADDNKYPSGALPTLRFDLGRRSVVVSNNEVGFSAKNIRALCDVGSSTKTNADGYIGMKGIGFKSVFRVTTAPEVHSSGYHISFDLSIGPMGYILPTWLGDDGTRESARSDRLAVEEGPHATQVVLPLSAEMATEDRREVLLSKLDDIHPSLLLFVRKLRRIVIRDHVRNMKREMVRTDREDNVVEVSVNGTPCRWLLQRLSLVPEIMRTDSRGAQKRTELALAFPLRDESDPHRFDTDAEEMMVFAFLPLRACGLKFVLQGDWTIPSSREDVDAGSPWNQWLRSHVAPLFVSSLEAFKSRFSSAHEALSSFLTYVPCGSGVVGFFRPLVDDIKRHMLETKCLVTVDGHWERPVNIVVVPEVLETEHCRFTEVVASGAFLQEAIGKRCLHQSVVMTGEVAQHLGLDMLDLSHLLRIVDYQLKQIAIGAERNEPLSRAAYNTWLSRWLLCVQACLDGHCGAPLTGTVRAALLSKLRALKMIPLCPPEDPSGADLARMAYPLTLASVEEGGIFFGAETEAKTGYAVFLAHMRVIDPALHTSVLEEQQHRGTNLAGPILSCLRCIAELLDAEWYSFGYHRASHATFAGAPSSSKAHLPSSFALCLQTHPWLPTSHGTLEKPQGLLLDGQRVSLLRGAVPVLVIATHNKAFIELLGVRVDVTPVDVLQALHHWSKEAQFAPFAASLEDMRALYDLLATACESNIADRGSVTSAFRKTPLIYLPNKDFRTFSQPASVGSFYALSDVCWEDPVSKPSPSRPETFVSIPQLAKAYPGLHDFFVDTLVVTEQPSTQRHIDFLIEFGTRQMECRTVPGRDLSSYVLRCAAQLSDDLASGAKLPATVVSASQRKKLAATSLFCTSKSEADLVAAEQGVVVNDIKNDWAAALGASTQIHVLQFTEESGVQCSDAKAGLLAAFDIKPLSELADVTVLPSEVDWEATGVLRYELNRALPFVQRFILSEMPKLAVHLLREDAAVSLCSTGVRSVSAVRCNVTVRDVKNKRQAVTEAEPEFSVEYRSTASVVCAHSVLYAKTTHTKQYSKHFEELFLSVLKATSAAPEDNTEPWAPLLEFAHRVVLQLASDPRGVEVYMMERNIKPLPPSAHRWELAPVPTTQEQAEIFPAQSGNPATARPDGVHNIRVEDLDELDQQITDGLAEDEQNQEDETAPGSRTEKYEDDGTSLAGTKRKAKGQEPDSEDQPKRKWKGDSAKGKGTGKHGARSGKGSKQDSSAAPQDGRAVPQDELTQFGADGGREEAAKAASSKPPADVIADAIDVPLHQRPLIMILRLWLKQGKLHPVVIVRNTEKEKLGLQFVPGTLIIKGHVPNTPASKFGAELPPGFHVLACNGTPLKFVVELKVQLQLRPLVTLLVGIDPFPEDPTAFLEKSKLEVAELLGTPGAGPGGARKRRQDGEDTKDHDLDAMHTSEASVGDLLRAQAAGAPLPGGGKGKGKKGGGGKKGKHGKARAIADSYPERVAAGETPLFSPDGKLLGFLAKEGSFASVQQHDSNTHDSRLPEASPNQDFQAHNEGSNSNIFCFICGSSAHLARSCPTASRESNDFHAMDYSWGSKGAPSATGSGKSGTGKPGTGKGGKGKGGKGAGGKKEFSLDMANLGREVHDGSAGGGDGGKGSGVMKIQPYFDPETGTEEDREAVLRNIAMQDERMAQGEGGGGFGPGGALGSGIGGRGKGQGKSDGINEEGSASPRAGKGSGGKSSFGPFEGGGDSGVVSLRTDTETKKRKVAPNVYDPSLYKDRDTTDDQGVLEKIGRWGEQYVFRYLRRHADPLVDHVWVNEVEETGAAYDIVERRRDPSTGIISVTYIEVKATAAVAKMFFQFTYREMQFAQANGQSFHVYRVFSAGTDAARIMVIRNPIAELKKGTISVSGSLCVTLRPENAQKGGKKGKGKGARPIEEELPQTNGPQSM
eukprot:gene9397-14574_t